MSETKSMKKRIEKMGEDALAILATYPQTSAVPPARKRPKARTTGKRSEGKS